MGYTTIRNAVARGSWHLPTRINTSEQSNAVSTLRSSLILTNPKLTMLQWTMVHHNLTHNHFADYHYARPASTRLSQSQPRKTRNAPRLCALRTNNASVTLMLPIVIVQLFTTRQCNQTRIDFKVMFNNNGSVFQQLFDK